MKELLIRAFERVAMCASTSAGLAPDSSEAPLVPTPAVHGFGSQAGDRASPGVRSILLGSWIGLLAIVGSFGVSPQIAKLWEIWTTDPLRSIGALLLPTSIVLILRVWQNCGWEQRGSWLGLPLVALAYAPLIFSHSISLYWAALGAKINFIPSVFPIYLYAGGVLLLFAGARVWRYACFPLALLLCLQPMPDAVVHLMDLPLQELAAHTARSFAHVLGFSPGNPELLRLMFTPDFGMFIAPGCDGMRGAVTLTYGALVIGYLKRVPLYKWSAYVVGAFLLGHCFNLIRLCALVLYYRVALGHLVLENAAKQADYVIGALLFLIAVFLFLWIVGAKVDKEIPAAVLADSPAQPYAADKGLVWKALSLTLLVLAVIVPGARAVRNPESLVLSVRRGEITASDLNARIPLRVGDYKLVRAWQEELNGAPAEESAVFENAASPEIEVGIWLPPSEHSIRQSLRVQGETPKAKAIMSFATAAGRVVQVNTALYDDGVTDTFTGDTFCSPSECQPGVTAAEGLHMAVPEIIDHKTRGKRMLPIFFKLQVPRAGSATGAVYQTLSNQCREFLSHLDLLQLSQRFQ